MSCSDSSDDGEEEEEDTALGLKEHATCLMPINLQSNVVVNEKQNTLNINTSSNDVVQVSPGQGIVCIYLIVI